MLDPSIRLSNPKRLYPFTHSSIQCYFKPSARDFAIKEVPLYDASGSGEHLLIYVRKKGLSTFELLHILSSALGCKVRDIGYAGLKDKAAISHQYLSVHRSKLGALESALAFLESQQIKILSITPHNNKLKMGHLKGNHFFVRLKKVSPTSALKLQTTLEVLIKSGFPNYFGFQRFGKDGDNHKQGEAIAKRKMLFRNKKIGQFLISSYQSVLFNAWLASRVQLSQILKGFTPKEALEALKHPSLPYLNPIAHLFSLEILKILQKQPQIFTLLPGEVLCHFPFGKTFICEDVSIESTRFYSKDIAPMGALCGAKLLSAQNLALAFENQFLDSEVNANGVRRYAWVWAEDVQSKYIEQKAHFELQFFLPKGVYATTFLEALLGRECVNENEVES